MPSKVVWHYFKKVPLFDAFFCVDAFRCIRCTLPLADELWLKLNGWPLCFWLALKVLRVLSGRWSAIQLLSIKCSGKIWRLNWRVEEPKTRHYVPLKRSFQIMWTTVHHCIVHIFTKWIYQICLIVISLTICCVSGSRQNRNQIWVVTQPHTQSTREKRVYVLNREVLKMASGAVKRSVGIIRPQSTALFLCDMQEKFAPNIKFFPQIVSNSSR